MNFLFYWFTFAFASLVFILKLRMVHSFLVVANLQFIAMKINLYHFLSLTLLEAISRWIISFFPRNTILVFDIHCQMSYSPFHILYDWELLFKYQTNTLFSIDKIIILYSTLIAYKTSFIWICLDKLNLVVKSLISQLTISDIFNRNIQDLNLSFFIVIIVTNYPNKEKKKDLGALV